MQLTDLEDLLGITIAEDKKRMYERRLKSAIGEAKRICNNSFENDSGVLEIPEGADMGIALLVRSMGESHNVAGQSLGDMSKSFFEGGTYKMAKGYLKPFRKAGIR